MAVETDIELVLDKSSTHAASGPPFSSDRQEYEFLSTQFDKEREAALLRKVDWRLLPVLSIFYLVCAQVPAVVYQG